MKFLQYLTRPRAKIISFDTEWPVSSIVALEARAELVAILVVLLSFAVCALSLLHI